CSRASCARVASSASRTCETPTFASTSAWRIIARTARPSAGEDARFIASRQACLILSNMAPVLDAQRGVRSLRFARRLRVELAHPELHVVRPAVRARDIRVAVLRNRFAHGERRPTGLALVFVGRHTAPSL